MCSLISAPLLGRILRISFCRSTRIPGNISHYTFHVRASFFAWPSPSVCPPREISLEDSDDSCLRGAPSQLLSNLEIHARNWFVQLFSNRFCPGCFCGFLTVLVPPECSELSSRLAGLIHDLNIDDFLRFLFRQSRVSSKVL